MNCFSKKNFNIELTASIRCMTMNRRRLVLTSLGRISCKAYSFTGNGTKCRFGHTESARCLLNENNKILFFNFQIFCATPLSGSTSDLESQERLVRPSSSSPSAASTTAGCLRGVGGGGGGSGGGAGRKKKRSGSRSSSGSSDNEEDCETR